jgi:hypothetical protein
VHPASLPPPPPTAGCPWLNTPPPTTYPHPTLAVSPGFNGAAAFLLALRLGQLGVVAAGQTSRRAPLPVLLWRTVEGGYTMVASNAVVTALYFVQVWLTCSAMLDPGLGWASWMVETGRFDWHPQHTANAYVTFLLFHNAVLVLQCWFDADLRSALAPVWQRMVAVAGAAAGRRAQQSAATHDSAAVAAPATSSGPAAAAEDPAQDPLQAPGSVRGLTARCLLLPCLLVSASVCGGINASVSGRVVGDGTAVVTAGSAVVSLLNLSFSGVYLAAVAKMLSLAAKTAFVHAREVEQATAASIVSPGASAWSGPAPSSC